MPRPTEKLNISDQSSDRKYWVQLPMIVWALAKDPYELSLWLTIKSIAWPNNECRLTTGYLAKLSMMSVGKVHECRAHLIELGLLTGEIRKDPNYPQPVWHLTIPDLWEMNALWAKANASIEQKLAYKALQLSELSQQRKSLRQSKYLQSRKNTMLNKDLQQGTELHSSEQLAESTREESVHTVKMTAICFSPDEKGLSLGEKRPAPDEKGSSPGENSLLYIDQVDPLVNLTEEATTTLQYPDLAFPLLNGGGGLISISTPTVPPFETSSPETPDAGIEALPIALRSFSHECQLVTMRIYAHEVISELPQAWWGREHYLNTLSVAGLYRLCTWLYVWSLLQAPPHGLYDAAVWNDYKTVIDLYQQLYANINNLPAIIKVRVKEADAPMHDYDQQQFVQLLTTRMEELTRAAT